MPDKSARTMLVGLLTGAIMACVSATAHAVPAVSSISGGSNFAIFYGGSTGDVVGWDFSIAQSITVTDLGVQHDTSDGTPDSSHQVGIWNAAMALLASTTVTPGVPMDGFHYNSIAPLVLGPGTYTVGAVYTTDDNDSYLSSPSSVTTAPEVTFIQGRFPSAGSLGLVFPANTSANNGRYGPNFLYTTAAVPEPGTLALFGLGLAGLAAARRRKDA